MKTNGIIALAAAVLVAASAGCWYLDREFVTDEQVLAVTDPYEFVAVADGTYNDGVLTISVQTNAPDGALFDIYAQHPDAEEVYQGELTVEKGVGTTEVEIPEGMSTQYLTTYAVMDMAKQTGITRYGTYGEKMVGDRCMTMDGVYTVGVSFESYVAYPSEEEMDAALEEEFPMRIDYVLQMYSRVLQDIQPGEGDDWSNMTIVFTEDAIAAWDEFTPELQDQYYTMFESIVKTYKKVPEDATVQITFVDGQGNVMAQNY